MYSMIAAMSYVEQYRRERERAVTIIPISNEEEEGQEEEEEGQEEEEEERGQKDKTQCLVCLEPCSVAHVCPGACKYIAHAACAQKLDRCPICRSHPLCHAAPVARPAPPTYFPMPGDAHDPLYARALVNMLLWALLVIGAAVCLATLYVVFGTLACLLLDTDVPVIHPKSLFANETTMRCVLYRSEHPDVSEVEWRALTERVAATPNRPVRVLFAGEVSATHAHATFPDEQLLDFAVDFGAESRALLQERQRVEAVAAAPQCQSEDWTSGRFVSLAVFGFALFVAAAYCILLVWSCCAAHLHYLGIVHARVGTR